MPSNDEMNVIRKLLDAEERLVVDDDFVIEDEEDTTMTPPTQTPGQMPGQMPSEFVKLILGLHFACQKQHKTVGHTDHDLLNLVCETCIQTVQHNCTCACGFIFFAVVFDSEQRTRKTERCADTSVLVNYNCGSCA